MAYPTDNLTTVTKTRLLRVSPGPQTPREVRQAGATNTEPVRPEDPHMAVSWSRSWLPGRGLTVRPQHSSQAAQCGEPARGPLELSPPRGPLPHTRRTRTSLSSWPPTTRRPGQCPPECFDLPGQFPQQTWCCGGLHVEGWAWVRTGAGEPCHGRHAGMQRQDPPGVPRPQALYAPAVPQASVLHLSLGGRVRPQSAATTELLWAEGQGPRGRGKQQKQPDPCLPRTAPPRGPGRWRQEPGSLG